MWKKRADMRETVWWQWQRNNYRPYSVLCLGWSEQSERAEKVWTYCFCRVCWYFILCESDENSLILLLHFPLRLYSKVTGRNAIPNYCRSPLPISIGHSMLPDITGLKLWSIHPICSEYPFPAPLFFIWSLLVAPSCYSSFLHPQNLRGSQYKIRWGNWTQCLPSV